MSTPEDDDKYEELLELADKITEIASRYREPEEREYRAGMIQAAHMVRSWANGLR